MSEPNATWISSYFEQPKTSGASSQPITGSSPRRETKFWIRALGWTLLTAMVSGFAAYRILEEIYEVPLTEGSFRFERPWAALLLLAAPLAFVTRVWLHRLAAPRFRVSRGLDLLAVGPGKRVRLRPLLIATRVVALILMTLALMGPQSIHARDAAEIEGIDILLTLDLSLSMEGADISPNRFEASKYVVDDFLSRRPNDRIGAVVFGREAYTLLPLTSDKDALRTMIRELELGMIDGRGTAIGNAIGVSLNRLRRSHAKSKVLILLTDGESNSGNVSPEQAAEFAQTMKVKIFAVLMGQSDKAKVQRGVDWFGRPAWDYGQFPVNPELLRKVAKQTGGEYFQVTDREGLERSFHSILDRLEKSKMEDTGRVYGELFPAFLWPALFLLMLEQILSALWLRVWP